MPTRLLQENAKDLVVLGVTMEHEAFETLECASACVLLPEMYCTGEEKAHAKRRRVLIHWIGERTRYRHGVRILSTGMEAAQHDGQRKLMRKRILEST